MNGKLQLANTFLFNLSINISKIPFFECVTFQLVTYQFRGILRIFTKIRELLDKLISNTHYQFYWKMLKKKGQKKDKKKKREYLAKNLP